MFERIRNLVLPLLKVPHEPTPPAGAPGSIRVFRAGRNFYKLRLLSWGIGQAGALAGIIFSLVMLERLEAGIDAARHPGPQPAAAGAAPTPAPSTAAKSRDRIRLERAQAKAEQFAARWPDWVFPLLKVAELGGILLYLVQLPVTYALARLDYELRWYIVTDRSLRIRSGLTKMQETTMSFANVQQVVVNQGPLQRLLGIADVRVQSAGGGGGGGSEGRHKEAGDSLHAGVFHGVDNANEIRDLILERLRRFRETGLGDPDETRPSPHATTPPTGASPALAAAREVLAEARALRRMV
jgi:membrane protein YdbS with pleckstrin-like domain